MSDLCGVLVGSAADTSGQCVCRRGCL